MLDLLDIRTLAFTTIFFGLCFGLGLIVYSSTLKKFKMVFYIGLGILFIGLAQFLISLRNQVSDFISIVIANELSVIALMLIYSGLHTLCQMKFNISKAFIVTLLVFIFFSFSYYTYIDPSMKSRVVIISYTICLMCLLCAHVVFTAKLKESVLPLRILGVIFSVTAIIELLRITVDTTLNNVIGLDDLHGIHTLLFFTALLLITLLSFCVVWIVNLQLQEALKTLSKVDYLTKLNNRRSLEKIAETELARSNRNNQTLSIIMCDIDLFKKINDQHGHLSGDSVLIQFSDLIKKNLRTYDIAARYGGEEFLFLLPNTGIEQAIVVAQKLREIIAANTFTSTSMDTLSITASFGVTSNSDSSINWDNMVQAADSALYEAKQSGRNKVIKGTLNNINENNLSLLPLNNAKSSC